MDSGLGHALYAYHAARSIRRKWSQPDKVVRTRGVAAVITKWEGGTGGLDRSLSAMVRSIVREGFAVDVFTEMRMPTSHHSVTLDRGVTVTVVGPTTVPRTLDGYDFVYVFPYHTASLWRPQLLATRALTIFLGGLPFVSLPACAPFDVIHYESPASSQRVWRSIVAPPDVLATPIPELPRPPGDAAEGPYVLTVFNPWGRIKGLDDMLTYLQATSTTLVWCCDDTALEAQGLSDEKALIDRAVQHPRVRVAKNLGIEQIWALYRDADAYACFSKSESFGWALADAIRFGKPICSRRTGVLSYFGDFVGTTDFARPAFEVIDVAASQAFNRKLLPSLL